MQRIWSGRAEARTHTQQHNVISVQKETLFYVFIKS